MTAHGVMIAIDGPSGSGKSSVSRAVAAALGFGFLDTGAMYRALTWWCLERGIDLSDQPAVALAAEQLPLEYNDDPTDQWTRVDGTDVTTAIRASEISGQVSMVATNLGVRPVLQRSQRAAMERIAQARGGVVAEGRDITTVVASDADVRILLTASEQARLHRRSHEIHGETSESAIDRTRDEVLRRDLDDSTVSQFTVAADGVVTVETSELTFEQSVAAVLEVVAAHRS